MNIIIYEVNLCLVTNQIAVMISNKIILFNDWDFNE